MPSEASGRMPPQVLNGHSPDTQQRRGTWRYRGAISTSAVREVAALLNSSPNARVPADDDSPRSIIRLFAAATTLHILGWFQKHSTDTSLSHIAHDRRHRIHLQGCMEATAHRALSFSCLHAETAVSERQLFGANRLQVIERPYPQHALEEAVSHLCEMLRTMERSVEMRWHYKCFHFLTLFSKMFSGSLRQVRRQGDTDHSQFTRRNAARSAWCLSGSVIDVPV